MRFYYLVIVFFIIVSLLGYYPTLNHPPVRKSVALAQTQEQKEEVIASFFSQPLILPHPGFLSTKFSNWHPGIDIAAGLGMPIHPITEGEVLEVGTDLWGLGKYLVVSHQNGLKSKYAHLGKIFVKAEDKVTLENILGEVGLTGYTSGPHTHLEITHNGKSIDPLLILPTIQSPPPKQ